MGVIEASQQVRSTAVADVNLEILQSLELWLRNVVLQLLYNFVQQKLAPKSTRVFKTKMKIDKPKGFLLEVILVESSHANLRSRPFLSPVSNQGLSLSTLCLFCWESVFFFFPTGGLYD